MRGMERRGGYVAPMAWRMDLILRSVMRRVPGPGLRRGVRGVAGRRGRKGRRVGSFILGTGVRGMVWVVMWKGERGRWVLPSEFQWFQEH